jgi:ubiquinone/menaquinone biosynthesis C-methylase UbiE
LAAVRHDWSTMENGFRAVTVLDLSDTALMAAKARLGRPAEQVQWVVADVTE